MHRPVIIVDPLSSGIELAPTFRARGVPAIAVTLEHHDRTEEYTFKKTVIPVFLKSLAQGIISNVEAFDDVSLLPTLFRQYIWAKNGEPVPRTEDYLTSIGIIALTGDRASISADYEEIRRMESKLVIHRNTD